MIKKIIVENWKSYRYAELPIDPLTVLIGNNASGKSNLIEALEYLSRISRGMSVTGALQDDFMGFSPIRGSREFLTFKKQQKFAISAIVNTDREQDYTYKISIRSETALTLDRESLIANNDGRVLFKIENPAPSSGSKNVRIQIGDSVSQIPFNSGEYRLNDNYSFLGRILLSNWKLIESKDLFDEISQVLRIILSIFTLNPMPDRMRSYSSLSDELAADASNIAGVLSMQSPEECQEFKALMNRYFETSQEGDILEIWAELVGRLGNDAMLYCREQWPGCEPFIIDARSMSDGTLRFAAILTALLTRPKGSQLIIEDIDNGLHPTRFKQLLAMLQEIGAEREIDVLVTTHNPGFLDELDPELIPFTVVCHRDSETGESKLTLLEDIDHFAKLFASASLGKLAIQGAIERGAARTK